MERPGEIRRELQRVRASRNQHKEKNREQVLNKRLQDRKQEITLSRDKWKKAFKQSREELKALKRELLEKLEKAQEEIQPQEGRRSRKTNRATTARDRGNSEKKTMS